jgi:hypothetical protein
MSGTGFQVTTILKALADADVRYVTVGGFAVIMHGHLRTTKDLDLVVDLEPDNCKRALEALSGIGLQPRLPVQMVDFADPEIRRDWHENRNMQVFQIWDPENPIRCLDVFVREPIKFEELWAQSIKETLDGVPIHIASIEHLIEMKKQAGRERDITDIQALEAIRANAIESD